MTVDRSAATVADLADAVHAGDLTRVRAMLEARPELVHMDMASNNEHRPLHYAVLDRLPEMVRVLMEHGADARKGVYPHREATSALTIARERGYGEIVTIIEEEEGRRGSTGRETSPTGADVAPDGALTSAVKADQPDTLARLLESRLDPDERTRVEGLEPAEYSWGMPLWHCARLRRHAMAEMLLQRGADPNGRVYASGSPVTTAYSQRDQTMIDLLARYGGQVDAITAGLYREEALAARMLAGELDGRLSEGHFAGKTVAEQLLWGAACGGSPEIVQMALEHIDWPREDARWHAMLEQPLRLWNHMDGHWAQPTRGRDTYFTCFRMMLARGDANVVGRFGRVILHDVAAFRRHMTEQEAVAFATMLVDAGARLDIRDDLLKSTPLGWACRWGRLELVKFLLSRGADPIEADAEPWATPRAWAEKMKHDAVLALLR